MAFDFPASPTNGQLFTPIAGGLTYVFQTPVWKQMSNPIVSISDTAPSSPAVGQLWWESTTGALFLWYNDGDSSQWVQINATST